MITTVRIAPIEQWCAIAKSVKGPTMELAARIVGMPVDIFTESLGPHSEHGDNTVKTWIITEESKKRIFEAVGRPVPTKTFRFCEHMLEMD